MVICIFLKNKRKISFCEDIVFFYRIFTRHWKVHLDKRVKNQGSGCLITISAANLIRKFQGQNWGRSFTIEFLLFLLIYYLLFSNQGCGRAREKNDCRDAIVDVLALSFYAFYTSSASQATNGLQQEFSQYKIQFSGLLFFY